MSKVWTPVLLALAMLGCTQPRPATWPGMTEPGTARSDHASLAPMTVRQHTFATRAAYAHPALSPDGKRIAYAATLDGPSPDIYVQALGERAAHEVARHPADDITPCFSPDGRSIAFASNRDGRWNIYITDFDGGPLLQVTDDTWDSFAPSFSPDGEQLAYSTRPRPGDPWMIAVTELNTGARTLLCEGMWPAFSPAGDLIAFSRNSRNAPGWPSLWTVTPDGRRQTEIYRSDTHGAITPSFAGPDHILFSTLGRIQPMPRDGILRADDIWVVHLSGRGASRATWHGLQDWSPVYEPLAGRCYFISSRDGAQNIYSAELKLPRTTPAPVLPVRVGEPR